MIYEVEIEGRTRRVSVERAEHGWNIRVDGGPARLVSGKALGRAEWLLREDGRGRSLGCWVDGEHVYAQVGGHALRATVIDPRKKALEAGSAGSEGLVATPMPGVVNRVLVTEGQEVAKGQVLLVVEAMKMENEFRSPVDGTVRTIHVKPGNAVEANAPLVVVEPA